MWLLDEEEEDDDFMLTVTLLHAAKRHKKIFKSTDFGCILILGGENNLAYIII